MNDKILIIHKSDLARFWKDYLIDNGFKNVLIAHNSQDGILIAKNENPDLILLELCLENSRTGFEVAEKLLIEKIETRIILYLGPELSIEALAWLIGSGICDFFSKPLKTKEVVAKIKYALSTKNSLNTYIANSNPIIKKIKEKFSSLLEDYNRLKQMNKILDSENDKLIEQIQKIEKMHNQ